MSARGLAVWEVLAAEAAKAAVTASVSGVFVAGAGQVLRALRRRRSTLPEDPQELAALIVEMGEQDPAFAAEIADAVASVTARAGSGMLPPALFVDRDSVRGQVAEPGAWLVAGAYGTGKTALVLQVMHDVADGFPGGCAYVDFDGHRDGDTLRMADVMASVLRQLGVDPGDVPLPVLREQYLRALVHRRLVLVLDNVLGAAETRSLTQPWPASLVLVTTRMLSDDLHMWAPTPPVILHGLDEAGAWQLLESRAGPDMLAAEPQASVQLLELCDRMPFEILQVGVRLSRRRGEAGAVGAVLKELQGAPGADGLGLACVSRTVAELPAATVDALVVLAQHPGDDLGYAGAEAMLGARDRVAELVDTCLLQQVPRGRLRLPRLVRGYAGRLRDSQGVDTEAGLDRLLCYVRDHAVAADLALDSPGEDRLRRYAVPEGLSWPLPHIRPIDWLETEARLIAALVAQAHARGRYVQACQLCGALEVLLTNRGHHWLVEGANRWGILAAQALGQPVLEARLHAMQGRIYTQLHLLDRAHAALTTASGLIAGVDDPRMHSSVLEFHARLGEERAELSAAIETLRQCLAIDESGGLPRAARLHRRMLANVLVKAGQPEQARTLLDHLAAHPGDPRNTARVHMVRARMHVALGELARASAEVTHARALAGQAGATQYNIELADIEAQIAWQARDIETVRARWGWIAQVYWNTGHPRFDHYFRQLSQLPPPPR